MKTKALNSIKGKLGENEACKYIKKRLKYKILCTNFSNHLGEIDIVTLDGDYICFVEVKYKSSNLFGMPREMVTPYKQSKLRRVAELYLIQNNCVNSPCRFDVAEVTDEGVEYIKNAF